ncbi:MAG: sulfatase-like hydrolase/transferase [Acidobacteria bacterium]|nr:sulfatase-like hydrolase/transferase [Acidobacteriota bacterium]
MITIDTLRADALGFAGNPLAETPHLDGLAAAGWVFERAHGHSVMTLPSHASLLTGLLPYEHGVRDNAGFVLPDRVPTAAEAFEEAGFRTAAFVAAFPLDARYGLDRGFEVYDDSYPEGATRGFSVAERSGAEVIAGAAAWWREHEGERRFLWVHLYEPHAPYEPPEPFADRFAGGNAYLGEVAAADAYVGRLLDDIAPPGARSGVLVAVTSDHGEALGDHGEDTHGLFAYEATLAVPLVLWSEALDTARVDALVRHIDVLPTMLEAAGLPISSMPGIAGRSLWRAPSGGETASGGVGAVGGSSATYFEALHTNLQRGWAPLRGVIAPVTSESNERGPRLMKYVDLPLPELYDLEADPAEAQNLHASEEVLGARLAVHLPAESEWPPAVGAVSEDELRALRSLGYMSSSSVGVRLPRNYGEEDDPKKLVELDGLIQDYSEAYRDARLDRAEALSREMIRRRPQMGLGYFNLAQTLLDLGRIEEALDVMIDAERRQLASLPLQRQLALTLVQVGRHRDAVRLMERHGGSGDPDTLNVLGLVLAEAGETARARAVLLRSLGADERNPEARQNLALTALYESDWPLGEREARIALGLNSGLSLAWNYLGIALYNQRRMDEAIDALQQSVELDPGDLDVLYNLGTVAAGQGRLEVAKPVLERFLREATAPAQRGRYAAEVRIVRSLLRGF